MKRFKLFNHPIFSVITILGFLFLNAPITAAEEKVFDANPVVAELENVPVKLEDLRNKKIYDLSLQLYQQLQVEWDKIESIPLNLLVNILSMNLDFNPIEKQALLEADDLNQRWDNLIALMQMAALEEVSNPSDFIN